jgi:hypothetical protein
MKTILLFFFFVGATVAFGQNKTNVSKDSTKYKHAATITLTAFPYSIGVQPGFQFRMGGNFDVLTEGAFASTKRAGDYNRLKIIKLVSELKYYSAKPFAGRYYSFQAGYISRRFTESDTGWYFKDTATIGYSSAGIRSNISFVSLKLGREINPGAKVFLDFFVGLGVRYVQTSYDVSGRYSRMRPGGARDNIFELFGNAWVYERNYFKLHGTAGVRIGLRF